MKSITLNIEGMSCGHCQKHVSSIFAELNGVDSVDVDLENESAEISFNENEISEADLKNALKDTPYSVL